jgi:hypothetical protein
MLANQIPRARVQLNLDWHTHFLVGDKEHQASVVYSVFHDLSVAAAQAHAHDIEAVVAYPTASPEAIFPSASRQVSPGMRSSWMILTVATTTSTSTSHFKVPVSVRILRNEANEVAWLSRFTFKSDGVDLPMRDTAFFEKGDRGCPGAVPNEPIGGSVGSNVSLAMLASLPPHPLRSPFMVSRSALLMHLALMW